MSANREASEIITTFSDRDKPAPGAGQEENGYTFAGHEELRVYEPALLDTLRQRADDRRVCYVHLIDGSELYGTITLISDDGRVGVVEDGRDEYTFDTSLVAVVQTPRNGKPKV